MSAEEVPSLPPSNRDLVSRFREEYEAALIDAKISADHTATEGWQRLYAAERDRQIEYRRNLAQTLRNVADRAEARGLSEEEDKEISEAKKSSADIRDRHEIFERETIDPVREAVRTCDRIIDEVKSQAYRDEHDAPLVNVGMVEIVKMEIAKHPRPRWNEDKGQVLIAAAE